FSLMCMLSRPLICTLFPYTTLFRSGDPGLVALVRGGHGRTGVLPAPPEAFPRPMTLATLLLVHGDDAHLDLVYFWAAVLIAFTRSEEHTSELQSRFDLVCRLLLEKK